MALPGSGQLLSPCRPDARGGGRVQIIEVTDLGVRSAVIRLRRRETPLQFVLYPMIHMAEPAFYAAVTARLKRADVIVVEGVGGGGWRGSLLVSVLTLSYRVLRFNRRAKRRLADRRRPVTGGPATWNGSHERSAEVGRRLGIG